MMRPKSFITKQEREDFGRMNKDLQDGTCEPSTVNRVLSHVIKNRTRFNAQIDPKFLLQKFLDKYFRSCLGTKKKAARKTATDRD